jgi:hypothetical protein
MAPTSWCCHPSNTCTRPPAWHACTALLGIITCS